MTTGPRAPDKVGLIGLGKVGRATLKQMQSGGGGRLGLWWAADSSCLVSKEGAAFSPAETARLLQAKENGAIDFGAACERSIPGAQVTRFEGHREEVDLLRGQMADPREWIILDTAASSLDVDYRIASAMIGAAGLCTASKTAWADDASCTRLLAGAEKRRTLLGLNCTTGVWVDQMEILPIVASELRTGPLTMTKRDNSSFNLFFSELSGSSSPEEALRKIEAAGYLEPDADGLNAEIRDQVVKARVAANVCAWVRGIIDPSFSDRSAARPKGLASTSPDDIAGWYLDGRQRGTFPALISRIAIEADGAGGRGSIRCSVAFEELPKGHMLARNFPGRSAVLVEGSPRTRFGWDEGGRRGPRPGRSGGYVYSGSGGAPRTAAKLLWEARRIARLSRRGDASFFAPIPILFALGLGDRSAGSLKAKIAARV